MHRKIATSLIVAALALGAAAGCSKSEPTTSSTGTAAASASGGNSSGGNKGGSFDASKVVPLELEKCLDVTVTHLELLTPKDAAAAKAAATKLKGMAPSELAGDIDTVAAAEGDLLKLGSDNVQAADKNITIWVEKACPSSSSGS